MKAMILCAGRGERMRPLTDATPKPLLSVAGKPLLHYHVENLVAAGITDIVINHAHLGEQIEQSLGDGSAFGACIHYSAEGTALETGGGILQALPLLSGDDGNEPFIIISGDLWTDFPLQTLQLQPDADCHLIMVNNPDYHPEGDFAMASPDSGVQPLLRPGNHQTAPTFTYASLGMLHPRLFADAASGVFPLADLLWPVIDAGRATGEYYGGDWFNVGTPDDLAAVDDYVSRRYQQKRNKEKN